MNNLIWIVFDSCRYDSFVAAKTPNIDRIVGGDQSKVHKRYSYASWTLPSHVVYLLGASPHSNPQGVFASEVYKKDFVTWGERLNIPDISFRDFVPQLSLPAFLRKRGYKTNALVSMPVLNQTTIVNNHFDRYQLMSSHNDFNAIIDQLLFDEDKPNFYLLNVGETHYPYTLPGESGDHLPRIHGMHGVFKHLDDLVVSDDGAKTLKETEDQFFDMDTMKELHKKQISNIEYLDGLFEKLYSKVPENTYFIVTADHGECFGEGGYFGHGPVFHEKVFEVFYLEGMLNK